MRGWEVSGAPTSPRPPTQAFFHPTAIQSSDSAKLDHPSLPPKTTHRQPKATSHLQTLCILVSQFHVTGSILHASLNPTTFSAIASEPLRFTETVHDHKPQSATALRWSPKSSVLLDLLLTLQIIISSLRFPPRVTLDSKLITSPIFREEIKITRKSSVLHKHTCKQQASTLCVGAALDSALLPPTLAPRGPPES